MWTKEDQGRLRTLHTKCMTVKEIAKEMDKPEGWIRTELKAMGYRPIERRERAESEFLKGKGAVAVPRREYTKITPETEKRVCELREQCFSTYQIADKLGIGNAKTVLNILKRNGYPTERGKFHKENKEDKPMKAAQINEDFDQAVNEMIAESNAKEKEPASVGADASSEVRNSPNISTSNDTTEPPKSQAVSGITALSLLESALLNAYGEQAEITRIFAERQIAELFFVIGGQEYGFTFGAKEGVPDYGNDKH